LIAKARNRPPHPHHHRCFIIRDHNGQGIAYVNYDGEKGWRDINHGLTRDEARRIALNIAKLPDLVKRPQY
jgi:hypothetical protein